MGGGGKEREMCTLASMKQLGSTSEMKLIILNWKIRKFILTSDI